MSYRLGIADLQVHTTVSDGMASPEDVVLWASKNTNLDVIAITDHDRIDGAFRAINFAHANNLNIEVIAGIEITTLSGHLLGLFLNQPIPPFRSLDRTVEAIRNQGGLSIIPHPMSLLPPSIRLRTIENMMASGSQRPKVDGIEVINPAPIQSLWQPQVRKRNTQSWHLAETGGSDAHFLKQVGSAVTRFPGRTADDLNLALRVKLTIPERRISPTLREIGLTQLIRQQKRAMSTTPKTAMESLLAWQWRKRKN